MVDRPSATLAPLAGRLRSPAGLPLIPLAGAPRQSSTPSPRPSPWGRGGLACIVLALAVLAGAARAQTFEREAAPFPVTVNGEAVPFPFAGGFFEPRPTLADLDGDGDADLVVNVGGAGLQLYERTDAGWTWRTDRLGGVEPGNWHTFGDLDNDGDLDLLTRGAPGRVRFWRNVGPGEDSPAGFPTFELAADGLTTTGGEPVAVEDSSIPALGDLDGDGDPDLLAGKADVGTITYHRLDGVRDGLPVFTFVTDTFEDIVVYEENPSCGGPAAGPPGPPGLGAARPAGDAARPTARHGANAIALVDLTADGLPELFWGDFFSPSLFYFVHVGTATEPEYRLEADRFPLDRPFTSGGYNTPAFGDADGDGDPDLVIGVQRGLCFQSQTAAANLLYFENTGTPGAPDFEQRTDRLVDGIDVGTRSAPTFADLDGDGDLDLVVGNELDPAKTEGGADLLLFENTGTASAPAFRLVDADWLGLAYDFGAYGPVFGDLDGDGDPDLLVGGFNGRFALLENAGTATAPDFRLADGAFGGIDAGQYGRAALGDLDGDGDLDLVTGASSGRVRLYRNVGTARQPAFETEGRGTPTAGDLAFAEAIGLPDDVGQDSAPALADLDGDGDLDLILGTAEGDLRVFQNVGTASAPQFQEAAPVPGGRRRTAPALGDLDGDGRPEVVAGADAGGLLFWRSAGEATWAEPEVPEETGLRVVPNPSTGAVAFRTAGGGGELAVFDARGRRVARLAVRAGEAVWDGATADRQPAAPGVYFAQLRDGDRTETVSFTRLR